MKRNQFQKRLIIQKRAKKISRSSKKLYLIQIKQVNDIQQIQQISQIINNLYFLLRKQYHNQPNQVYVFVPYYIPYQVPPVPKFDVTKEEQHSDSEKEQTKVMQEEIHTNASGIVRGKGQLWTEEEINNLVSFYKKYNGNWKYIIKHLKGRNISQCSQKYRKLIDQQKRTKKKWSAEEDRILLESYAEFGREWIKISQKLPGRTSKQVRDRYVNQIDPNINHQQWTDQEDEKILEEFKKGGARWAIISKMLNNRSENQVKNRFYFTILKKYQGQQHPYLKIQQ